MYIQKIIQTQKKEKETLTTEIKNVSKNFGYILLLDSIDNYNKGGKYEPEKDKNILSSTSYKQIFVMEQILFDTNNYKDFIVLDSNGEETEEDVLPTENTAISYYPYDKFNKEYKKYFDGDFAYSSSLKGVTNNKYDNERYVYYPNRRAGLNGMGLSDIIINKITYDNKNNEYSAYIKINYNNTTKSITGMDSSTGILKYTRTNYKINYTSLEIK